MEKNSSLLLKRPKFKDTIVKYWPLYLMFLPVVVLLVLFNYLPMYGIVLAFKDYWPQYGILGRCV